MTTTTPTPTPIAAVRSIGAAEAKASSIAAEIVGSVPDAFDWTGRGVIAEQVHLWATGTDDKSERPAQRRQVKGADGEPVNETTNYGRGVNSIVNAVRTILKRDKSDDDTPAERVLRVSLSGDGGGTVVVPEDDALYAALVALVTGAASESSDA